MDIFVEPVEYKVFIIIPESDWYIPKLRTGQILVLYHYRDFTEICKFKNNWYGPKFIKMSFYFVKYVVM
ncbi:hypothetical protein N473_24910 [Pseudoalteromonas luteoviolacea CPMOR-1]|uniref:Uncharacterized protein n=1 Tax=Pseudoalteromonas luteoviolacea CPMOR-1 TaxID=1365248 RepID=A0A161YHD8_9GAMM|nr:hypothetical protein N473_24910 [Pseudoalteromonas luteoviolacea CPMOR-1]